MNNIARIQEKLAEKNLDAVLVTGEKNQRYATGFPFTDGYVLVARRGAWLITDSRYIEAAEKAAPESVCVQLYDREHPALELVKAALAQTGAERVDLLGHLVMGAQEIADVARELNVPEDKSILLQHLLLSHHGEPEHGAAVIPVTAESELLAFLDKIDSRMEIYRKAILDTPEGSFSDRIFALDKHVYHHP